MLNDWEDDSWIDKFEPPAMDPPTDADRRVAAIAARAFEKAYTSAYVRAYEEAYRAELGRTRDRWRGPAFE